jgi:hypothetical protein
MAAALVAQPALAQVDEADRLARCQNNRDALARLEAMRGNYAGEEQIARARTALTAIAALEARINANFDQGNVDLRSLGRLRGLPQTPENAADIANLTARIDGYSRSNAELGERIRSAAAPFGLLCGAGDYPCARTLYQRLAQAIDASVALQPQHAALLRQIAAHRTNLSALRCDESVTATRTAQSAPPPLSGADARVVTIRGRYYSSTTYRYYQIAQEGVNFTFQSEDGVESGSGTITVLPTTQRLTMIRNGPDGTRTVNGVITMSGSDPTQVWLLNWYDRDADWQRSR